MAYEAETAIYNRLRQAPTFHPAGAALFVPDWTLEPGDVVTVRSGEDDYQVPVYSMDLQWQGQSRVSIQSTGNQKREPLPALQRRRYATGRTVYQQEQAIEELQEQTVEYTQKFEVSDQKVASIMEATGVKLDETTNLPVVDENGHFVFDTENVGATLMSRIDQTAAGVSSVVSQTGAVSAVYSKDIDYPAGAKVLYEGVAYKFTQAHPHTEGEGDGWTGTDVEAIPAMQTQITTVGQTADSVYSEVRDARDGQANLKSRIDQQANKIALVVTTENGTDKINTAGIILEINGGTGHSSTKIEADNVYIDARNQITLGDTMTVSGSTVEIMEGTSGDGTLTCYTIEAYNIEADGEISAPSIQATTSASFASITIDEDDYEAKSVSIAGTTLENLSLLGTGTDTGLVIPDAITDLQVVAPSQGSNTYTLQKKTISNTSWQNAGTFSRATSLSGGWSGATYTVTASPQDEAWSIDFVRGSTSDATFALELGTGTKNANNPKYLDFPVYIGSDNPSGQMTHNVTINKSINASAVWQAGYDSGSGSVTQRTASGLSDTITLTSSDTGTSNKTATVLYDDDTETTDFPVRIDASAVYGAGQQAVSVGSTFTTASAPSGVTPTPLTSGETYKLSVTKDGTAVSGEDKYYAVPTLTVSLQDKTVTTNGTVTCDSGYDGLGTVTVNVPQTSVQTGKTVSYSTNGTYTVSPSSGYDAMDSVSVTVNVPSSGTQRTASGLSDTITLANTDIGSSVSKTATVLYDDDTETTNFPVRINASAVYGKGLQDGNTISTITVEGTDLGNPSSDSNPGSVTLNAIGADGETVVKTDTYNKMYITNGTWNSSNKMAVNIRVGGDSSAYPLIARKWISAPSVSHNITCSSTVTNIGTNRGNRTNAGSISKSGLVVNSYLGFTISCGDTSKSFFISVNP